MAIKTQRLRNVRRKQQEQKIREAGRVLKDNKLKTVTQGTRLARQKSQITSDARKRAATRKKR